MIAGFYHSDACNMFYTNETVDSDLWLDGVDGDECSGLFIT